MENKASIAPVTVEDNEFVEPQIEATISGMIEEIKIQDLTDVGNSKRLVVQANGRVRHIKETHQTMIFSGDRWCQDRSELQKIIEMAIDSIYMERAFANATTVHDVSVSKDEIQAHATASASNGKIKAMIELAAAQPEIAISQEEMDKNPFLFNVKNGTIDLLTGELRPHNRDDLITRVAPVIYDKSATSPKFNAFMASITDGNKNIENYLKRVVGYILTGDTSAQRFWIFYGHGANGKSTFMSLISALLGEGQYAATTPSRTFKKANTRLIRNDLARLPGYRLVSASELDAGQQLDEALIKRVTGGERIAASFLRQEIFEYLPQFKVVMLANYLPDIRGVDDGIWRRIWVVPFARQFKKREINPNLLQELKAELSGILNWALEGCQEWQKRGLAEPEEVIAATDALRKERDVVQLFMDDRCTVKPSESVAKSSLYEAYTAWAEDACLTPLSKNQFGSTMQQKGFKNSKSGSVRSWQGLTLKASSAGAADATR